MACPRRHAFLWIFCDSTRLEASHLLWLNTPKTLDRFLNFIYLITNLLLPSLFESWPTSFIPTPTPLQGLTSLIIWVMLRHTTNHFNGRLISEGHFSSSLLLSLAVFQMIFNNPSKSLMSFSHRHLVNIPSQQVSLGSFVWEILLHKAPELQRNESVPGIYTN